MTRQAARPMGKTRGEGRAPAEKQQRVLATPESRREARAKRKREDEEWAARSGPVTVRKTGENDG